MPKVSALPAASTLSDTDIFAVVTDPGGSPVTKKATIAVLAAHFPPGPEGPEGPQGAPGTGAHVGTATVDFGSFPGTTMASVDVTGQTGITTNSVVRAWIRPTDTEVHSADEHLVAATMLDVVPGNIVADQGFTIHVLARDLGGSRLEIPGIGRNHRSNTAAAGANHLVQPAVGSVGGMCLNTHWGTYTLSWEWS